VSAFAFSRSDKDEAMAPLRAGSAMLNGTDTSFQILYGRPTGHIETLWRACLAESDFPTHYTAPEYFCERFRHGNNPFAVLSIVGGDVTAVMTGIHCSDRVQSGLSNRPQIVFSRHADRSRAMSNLIAGLLQEAGSAKLVDLFLWSDMAGLVDDRFRQRPYRGVVMLDLSLGPHALFRKFSQTRRNSIRWAIKSGVSVDPAKTRDEISAYYNIYVDWAPRRRSLPIIGEEQFQADFFATMGNRQLLLARHKGDVIAGVVLRFFPGGVVEHAGGSSLASALYLRPNDLLHWRAIEWAYAKGLTKYGLGGTDLFVRKFGGGVVPTTRHRLDRSLFRRHTIGDWMADRMEGVRPFIPQRAVDFGRSLERHVKALRAQGGQRTLLALYLASAASDCMTGQTILLAGGMSL
jgi:GNAT acetyltransferase-like protein